MLNHAPTLSPDELRKRLAPFCEKHHIRRLEVFGSAAIGQASPSSDVDLLVTLADSASVSTAELLEMAGEGEEVVRRRVDFFFRLFLKKTPKPFSPQDHLATPLC